MKKYVLIVLVLACTTMAAFAQNSDDDGTLTKVGQQSPVFKIKLDKSKVVSITDYKGKIVFINFFATWCPPCLTELPRIQKEVWEKFKDYPNFTLMALGREEGWDKILPFKAVNNYTFNLLPDEGRKVFELFATQILPRNVILDETGKIIYQSVNYNEREFNQMLTLLNNRLKKPLP
jgi:peroxiredoxin